MKKVIVLIGVAAAIISCKNKTENATTEANVAVAVEAEKSEAVQEEWEVLFNGTSFDGWKGYLSDEVGDAWKVEDGAMVFYPPKERKKGEDYNINTVANFTDFVLSLEWKISEGGNSGIFWGIKEDAKYKKPYHTAAEIQVLDNEKHPDAKNGTSHRAGALYDLVSPSEDVTNPVGEWNSIEITVNHKTNQGMVKMNGQDIVTFPVHGDGWDQMVANSKFKGWEGFGKFTTGKIGLQDHGDVVAFRNIKVKRL